MKLQAAIHFQRFARGMLARIKYTEKKKELGKRKREKAAALRQKAEDDVRMLGVYGICLTLCSQLIRFPGY